MRTIKIIIISFLFAVCIPSYGQFKYGMNDFTGKKPTFRSDLTPETAHALLSEEDYVKYCNSNKLYKAGSITLISGACLTAAVGAYALVNLHKPFKAATGANVQLPNEASIKVADSCLFLGAAAMLVGGVCMITGTVRTMKITNNYFNNHPYCELNVSISPSSIGLAYKF